MLSMSRAPATRSLRHEQGSKSGEGDLRNPRAYYSTREPEVIRPCMSSEVKVMSKQAVFGGQVGEDDVSGCSRGCETRSDWKKGPVQVRIFNLHIL